MERRHLGPAVYRPLQPVAIDAAVMDDITTDELKGLKLTITQHRHGYRFSLDPLVLCAFAAVAAGDRVADLGTGCGIIPLVLARQANDLSVLGVEVQESMAELARHNVAENGLEGTVTIVRADIASLKASQSVSSFDLVVANPPYRRPGTGRVSPRAGRDLARHESTATLADFLAVAKFLVKPAGRICLISHPSRLAELLMAAADMKLAALRLRMVHGSCSSSATMFLVELVKGRKGDLVVLPPLLVRDQDGAYTAELQDIFDGFGKGVG